MRTFIICTGLLHFTQIPAMLAAPKLLDWRGDFGKLSAMNRALIRVILTAIVLVVVGLGAVVVIASKDLARGTPLGVAFCAFLSGFWAYRAWAQLVIYRRLWPRGRLGKASYFLLSLLFVSLALAYATIVLVLSSQPDYFKAATSSW